MADLDGFDEQDQSEVFDEDNTNDVDRGPGEEAEQFEDLLDVYDATSAIGDDDEDEAVIGDEMDDEEIVAAASDDEDDDLAAVDDENLDTDDELAAIEADEVELEYIGDLNDLANASSAAQPLEAENLSDEDLRDLDYAPDEDGDAARP